MDGAVSTPQHRATTGIYGGLFVVTLATLMYEIVLTRIFSVTMWYHFAFMAISIALFGMTVGALIVYLAPDRFPQTDAKRHLWRFSLLFSVAIAVSFITQLTVPFVPRWSVVGVWSVLVTCVVISVPFTFSGVVVCLTLTRFPRQVNRLYGADLLGAALGCVLLVLLLSRMDGPSAVIAIAALASVGALLFAGAEGSTRGMQLAIVALVAFGGFALLNAYLSERREPILRIIWAKETSEPLHQYEKWNVFSRVTVDGDPDAGVPPYGWGMSTTLPANVAVNQLIMSIDGGAATVLTRYNGDPKTLDFLHYDVVNIVHYIRHQADVLVVGVGGGRDILSAINFDQRSITGVEINPEILATTNGAFGDFTGHLDRDPRVTFVNDEARSYLARTDRKYDIIQISLIDTWAATAAGAYALTENSLYTTEAWRIFFDRLKPGGVLSVSRWYSLGGQKPLETYRLTALAAEALKERGITNPRAHMLIFRSPDGPYQSSAATLLVSPDAFSNADVATLESEAKRLGFPVVLTPDSAIDQNFAALASPQGPDAAVDQFSEDISPPTDDRPFFFQMAGIKTLLSGDAFSNSHVIRPALVLGVLAVVVLGLTACCIVLPLLLTTKQSAHRGMFPFYVYFASIGLGFLLLEVSQLQRLSVFLGHPTYALTVVLFSILLSSGAGSILSGRIVRPDRPVSLLAPLALLMVGIAVFGFATPTVIAHMDSATTPVRILTAVGLLMPLGLLMGIPFPIGMRLASVRPGAPTEFLWGINGATSVCASVLGMVVALLWGISAAFWLGALSYLVALGTMAVLTFRPAPVDTGVETHALQGETAQPY